MFRRGVVREFIMQVRISECLPCDWVTASRLAYQFHTEYPDRIGIRNGVAYQILTYTFYVYRTKTQIVVRGPER